MSTDDAIDVDRVEDITGYSKRYSVKYYCDNCGKHFTKWILKGNRVPTVTCPNCECLVH